MKATITDLDGKNQVIEFGKHTRIKFDFGDSSMRFIEVSVGESHNGNPCLNILSQWNALIIEPIVSNVIKLRMVES